MLMEFVYRHFYRNVYILAEALYYIYILLILVQFEITTFDGEEYSNEIV